MTITENTLVKSNLLFRIRLFQAALRCGDTSDYFLKQQLKKKSFLKVGTVNEHLSVHSSVKQNFPLEALWEWHFLNFKYSQKVFFLLMFFITYHSTSVMDGLTASQIWNLKCGSRPLVVCCRTATCVFPLINHKEYHEISMKINQMIIYHKG